MKASCLVVAALSACAGLAYAQPPVSVYGVLEADGTIDNVCADCAPQNDTLSVLHPYSFQYLSLLDVGEAFEGSLPLYRQEAIFGTAMGLLCRVRAWPAGWEWAESPRRR